MTSATDTYIQRHPANPCAPKTALGCLFDALRDLGAFTTYILKDAAFYKAQEYYGKRNHDKDGRPMTISLAGVISRVPELEQRIAADPGYGWDLVVPLKPDGKTKIGYLQFVRRPE